MFDGIRQNGFIGIYDYFARHRGQLWASLAVLTLVLVSMVATMRYSENIGDFLPLDSAEGEALEVYQSISGAGRIILLFSNPSDPDMTVDAIDRFASALEEIDSEGLCSGMTTRFDMEQVRQLMTFVYDNMPYFLQDADYERIDSLLAEHGYISARLAADRQALMMPSGDFAVTTITRDPLGLFTGVMNDLSGSNPQLGFENYDGYIFTPDMSRAIAMLNSPFGSSETEGNTRIIKMMHQAAETMSAEYPEVDVHITGGPVIAVGNSSRIKTDSIIAISLSAVLIVLLLVSAFNSVRNILLILLSIGWGWLFALGGMAIFKDSVSIIVIGISSVILGIAVNYPLHLVAHTGHQKNLRAAIKEIAKPLIVGNITTVGAFLALVPLQSVALRDLGTFASLLLAGTIVFVLIYLPHMVKTDNLKAPRSRMLPFLAGLNPENSKVLVAAVAVLTAVLGYFSTGTSFDSNLSNINYMTREQREDMAYFQGLLDSHASSDARQLYVISSAADYDSALQKSESMRHTVDSLDAAGMLLGHKGVSRFLASNAEQQRRLEMWKEFAARFQSEYADEFNTAADKAGFRQGAFRPFTTLVSEACALQPREMEYFEPLTKDILSGNLAFLPDNGKAYVIDILTVRPDDTGCVKGSFDSCFDVAGINSALADNLSDNFNYIGLACSLIVFFFLWFSFGRIELAIISFLPMAISWVWILGIMSLLGIQFNIVNVILASFIFGQGDDYTIFMTEGCQHEYTYRRPILTSYKTSIIQSALIMFVGIGTLIVARHPAMRALAEVTIIGMFSVVFMAYLIPPLLFRWLTVSKGRVRRHPVTLATLLRGYPKDPAAQVYGRYIYKGSDITRSVRRTLASANTTVRDTAAGYLADNGHEAVIKDGGYGETAILAALTRPDAHITAVIPDDDRRCIAETAAADFVNNITFVNNYETED